MFLSNQDTRIAYPDLSPGKKRSGETARAERAGANRQVKQMIKKFSYKVLSI